LSIEINPSLSPGSPLDVKGIGVCHCTTTPSTEKTPVTVKLLVVIFEVTAKLPVIVPPLAESFVLALAKAALA